MAQLTVIDVLGEERLRKLRADGKDDAAILEEVNNTLNPVKETLGEEVYQGFRKQGIPFSSMHSYAEHLKVEADKEAKRKEEEAYQKQVDTFSKTFEEDLSGEDFTDRLNRGANRVVSEMVVAGQNLAGVKPSPRFVGVLKADEKLGEEYAKKRRTPEQQKIYAEKEKAFSDANGTLETLSAGADMLFQKVKNPTEWDMAGLAAEGINPLNWVGAGVGSVAAKAGTKVATSAALGAGADAAVNYGYDYNVERGKGASEEEATKAATLGLGANVVLGGATGGVSHLVAKRFKPTSVLEDPSVNVGKEDVVLPDDIATSELLQLAEAEDHSAKAYEVIKAIDAKGGTLAEREARVAKYVPPTQAEAQTSFVLNDGLEVAPSMAGGRAREKLLGTIANADKYTPDMLSKKLDDLHIAGEHKAKIMEAFDARDIGVYDAWASEKLAKDIDVRANRAEDTTREAGGVGDSIEGTGETVVADAGQTEIQTNTGRDRQAGGDTRQNTGDSGQGDGVPTVDAELAGQQGTRRDEQTLLRSGEDTVVQNENGVPSEPLRSATDAEFDHKTLTVQYDNGVVKKGGHRNWRNNNPGNIEYGEFAKAHGAIGSDGRFAIFPDMQDGYDAQSALLHSKNYKNLTLHDAIARYAPASENNVDAYVSAVTKNSAVKPDAVMRELTPAQLDAVVKAMSDHEGMKAGIELVGDREVVPGTVKEDLTVQRVDENTPEEVNSADLVDDAQKIDAEVAALVDEVDSKELPSSAEDSTAQTRGVGDGDGVGVVVENPVQKYERLKNSYETSKSEKLRLKHDAEAYMVSQDSVSNGDAVKYKNFTIKKYPKRVKAIESLLKNDKKRVVVEVPIVNKSVIRELKFKGDTPVKRVINSSDARHVLQNHGDPVFEAKRYQDAVTIDDIANYPEIVHNADDWVIIRDKSGVVKVLSAKQVNGHYIVIEEVSGRNNTLKLKTMYKPKGKLKPDTLFKKVDGASLLLTSKNGKVSRQSERMPASSANSIAKDDSNVKNSLESVKTEAMLEGHDRPLSVDEMQSEIDAALAGLEDVQQKPKPESVLDELFSDEKIDPKVERAVENIADPLKREEARAELEGRESLWKKEC